MSGLRDGGVYRCQGRPRPGELLQNVGTLRIYGEPLGFLVRVADCVEGLVPLTGPVTDLTTSVLTRQDTSVRTVAVDLARTPIVLAAEDIT